MQLIITGIGPGNAHYLTSEAEQHLKNTPCVIGSKRQVESVQMLLSSETSCLTYSGALTDLTRQIQGALINFHQVTVLASGDPNFYGITPYLKKTFTEVPIQVIWGMSSLQYLFTKMEIPMHDVLLTSAHGRSFELETLIKQKRIGLLTDKSHTPHAIATFLMAQNVAPLMIIGENLSYENERISCLRPQDVENKSYDMNVVIIDYER